MQPDEEAVYNLCTEVLTTKHASDAAFQAAKEKFGERGVVDMLARGRLLPVRFDAAERRRLPAARWRPAGAQATALITKCLD